MIQKQISSLMLKKVCSFDERKISKFEKIYKSLNKEERDWYVSGLNTLYSKWKYFGQFRNKISLNALNLAEKLKENCSIIIFPFVQIGTRRGLDSASGTWAWFVFKYPLGIIGSTSKINYCLQKTVDLFYDTDDDSIVASRKKGESYEKIRN